MSLNKESNASAEAAVSGAGAKDEFADCKPQSVDVVNTMPKTKNDACWTQLYVAAGIGNAAEPNKKSLRCAVYCYIAINGSSPSGEYTGNIVSGKGNTLAASEIPRVVGRFDVRRFMRANSVESVRYFHKTGVLETLPALVAKCEVYEIRASEAIALCDWLDGAEGLTPSERDAQTSIKNFNLSRSRASRGGKSVENQRDVRRAETVGAQGNSGIAPQQPEGW